MIIPYSGASPKKFKWARLAFTPTIVHSFGAFSFWQFAKTCIDGRYEGHLK